MTGFISFLEQTTTLIRLVTKIPETHAKWLNTLSYLENCGAKKIASCEHPTLVKEEMLKHASEEFRHAHYLKRQIKRVSNENMTTYSPYYILGGGLTMNYLNQLDLKTCRYLKTQGMNRMAIKEAAYLLVTYAIELRAGELYPIYDKILRKIHSKVTVKSILLEEQEHLKEMEAGITMMDFGKKYASYVCRLESNLYGTWIDFLISQMSEF